jgi:tRNA(Ile)-lysidine synthase
MNIEKRLNEFIVTQKLFSANEKIIVACSGGCDSVVLSVLLHKLNYKIVLAHCNFQLRGDEANGDEQFVKSLAEQLKIDFHVVHFDTEKYATENKLSIQQAARNLRYEWFEKLRTEIEFDKIATAHHLNDSIETTFINLIRGTGMAGLTGISSRNGKIIRPLLFANRNEMEEYATQNNILYRTDSSNLNDDYTRNKIRHQIIPMLKEINPSFEKTMQKNIERFAATENIFAASVQRKIGKALVHNKTEWRINLKLIHHHFAYSTLLFEMLKPFGFNASQVDDIVEAKELKSGAEYFSEKYRMVLHQHFLIITENKLVDNSVIIIPQNQEKVELPNAILKIKKIDWLAEMKFENDKNIAMIDAKNIVFPLVLRRWKQGDYFYPLGMNRKKKKLSDFFTQQKLSKVDKEKAWLLCSGDYILWVLGMRQDERFTITAQTTKTIVFKTEFN